jgi:diacylglycerol kinase family enzyme
VTGQPAHTGQEKVNSAATSADRPSASERLAAVVSLASLVAAAVLLLVGIAVNLGAVILALAGMLVCVTACWYVVARRGVIRIAAVVVAVVALAAIVAGLFLANIAIWRVTVIAIVMVLAVVTGRHALRRTPRALRSAMSGLPAAAPARHPVLIMNLKSGGGKAERYHLAEECRKRGIEPVILRPGDDLLQLAKDAIARGADVIGMAGGDGSQALVATVAARRGIPHVCVPAGTRNHFALDLGLDREDVVGALDAFSDGVEHRIDLATVNGRIFVNNASLGVYAKVVQSPEYRDAKLKTALDMLPSLLDPAGVPMDLRFTGPGGVSYPTAQMILVSNNPYQLINSGGRGTRERMDTGRLGIAVARVDDAAGARRFVTLELAGQARRFPGWLEWSGTRFEVTSSRPVEVGVDGEALVMDPPLIFEAQPGALLIRLPRHAVQRSPAARAVRLASRSTVADLGRVARGQPVPQV